MNKNKNNKLQKRPSRIAEPPEPVRINLPAQPVLRFNPTAWAKLLYMRDRRPLEVGGFAISPAKDLLLVAEFVTVRQQVTVVSVRFDDDAVADFLDQQIDAGLKPQQFMRRLDPHPSRRLGPSEQYGRRDLCACLRQV